MKFRNILLRDWNILFNISLSGLFLIIGGMIYIGFRSKDLILYKFLEWLDIEVILGEFRSICLNIDLPNWILYSAPDGLWLTSYLLIINTIWNNKSSVFYKVFIYILPTLAILLEFAQIAGWCPGTFDKIDLLCYIIPTIILTPLKYEF